MKVSLEDLLKSYVVSYGTHLGEPSRNEAQLSEGSDVSGSSGAEASCSEDDDDEAAAMAAEGEKAIDADEQETKPEKGKKDKKSGTSRKRREDEYNMSDSFIDDDEVAVAYESIFDLFHNHGEDLAEGEAIEARPRGAAEDEKPPLREFYVYRGEMQVEVVSKLRGKKKAKKEKKAAAEGNTDEEGGRPVKQPRKKKDEAVKEKTKKPGKGKENKKVKPASEPAKPQSTLERILSLEAKLEEPVKPAPLSVKETPEKAKRQTIDYDRLFAELESRLALEAWKRQAQSMEAFDPQKFPSALRDLTGSLTICYLRAAAPHHSQIEESLFEVLSKLVPYSAGALRKVTFKKILPLFLDEIGKKLESLYTSFSSKAEEISLPTTLSASQSNVAEALPATQEEGQQSGKGKVKFTEACKQLIYEIVRFELDSAYIEQSLKEYDVVETSNDAGSLPNLPGEMAMRKAIYQKIHQVLPAALHEHVTTNDISLQYGMQKRKIERKILRDHGVEPQIEQVGEKRKAPPSTLSAQVKRVQMEPEPVQTAHTDSYNSQQALTETLFPVEEALAADPIP